MVDIILYAITLILIIDDLLVIGSTIDNNGLDDCYDINEDKNITKV